MLLLLLSCVLVVVPATRSLNLGSAGIHVDSKGHIPTDPFCNTPVPGVYAVGDVLGKADLTPAAIQAGSCGDTESVNAVRVVAVHVVSCHTLRWISPVCLLRKYRLLNRL